MVLSRLCIKPFTSEWLLLFQIFFISGNFVKPNEWVNIQEKKKVYCELRDQAML